MSGLHLVVEMEALRLSSMEAQLVAAEIPIIDQQRHLKRVLLQLLTPSHLVHPLAQALILLQETSAFYRRLFSRSNWLQRYQPIL